ncbi:C45 family autoproteolytic acyltransferase/hydolase [Dongia mobilis]|nr:C45 family peptidase [Dongia mobilis]
MPDLAALDISGSPYEVGLQLGRFGARITHDYLRHSPAWLGVMAHRADPKLEEMRRLTQTRYAAYWQELQGLADGLDLPFDDVFLWNCRGDIWALAPDGCTTVQIPGDIPGAAHLIAHNEDGDPGLRSHCAIARIAPGGGAGFRSFIYPASLPGHTFAVTDRGLVQTVNNIRAGAGAAGLPRMVLGRAVLDCQDIDDAIALLKAAPRAGAFHFTLAQAGDPRILSIEFTHNQCSVAGVTGADCHANHLVHPRMTGEAQTITASSQARQRRAREMIAKASTGREVDALAILWDQANSTLPIYRAQPDDPDQENTLATAEFVVAEDAVDCRIHERDGSAPVMTFRVPAAAAA